MPSIDGLTIPTRGQSLFANSAWRAYRTANFSVPNAAETVIPFTADRFGQAGAELPLHLPGGPAVTGTVAKTLNSYNLTGTGTLFTSELAVGMRLIVPGGAQTDYPEVEYVSNDTTCQCRRVLTATATGQTATRLNSALIIRHAGLYRFYGCFRFAGAVAGNERSILLRVNRGANPIFKARENSNGTNPVYVIVYTEWPCLVDDYIEASAYQDSGGALDLEVEAGLAPDFGCSLAGADFPASTLPRY